MYLSSKIFIFILFPFKLYLLRICIFKNVYFYYSNLQKEITECMVIACFCNIKINIDDISIKEYQYKFI